MREALRHAPTALRHAVHLGLLRLPALAEQRRRDGGSRGRDRRGPPQGGRRGAKGPQQRRPRGGDPGAGHPQACVAGWQDTATLCRSPSSDFCIGRATVHHPMRCSPWSST